ncbi:hypothetical protein QN277_012672 [Acacia crassicarpa]|uniref:Uncharacterized protein n=1 Tax=Acacia crassicarpa TaxID=499986 RepID=A0AAE1TDA4_9FABA|nr:hypothetical protein QN277_012672 [Acacia crassicarpa]
MTNPPMIVVTFQLFFFFQLLSTIANTSYTPVEHFASTVVNPATFLPTINGSGQKMMAPLRSLSSIPTKQPSPSNPKSQPIHQTLMIPYASLAPNSPIHFR